jgi:N-acetylglucosaminyldiphosphoundecaprenol N-acetyl-beta-D-mannosaminyltransferase
MQVSILDLNFNCFDKNIILKYSGSSMMQVVTVNSEIFIKSKYNLEYNRILSQNITTIDSELLYKYLRRSYKNEKIKKISGSDLIYDIFDDCRTNRKSVFLLGSSNESNKKAVENIREKYDISIDGYSPRISSIPINHTEYKHIFNKLKLFKPHYLLVSLGVPKQEIFIDYYRKDLESIGVSVAVGVGGSIDFVSGFQQRAPKILQKLILEWFYRLIMDHSRLKRLIKIFPIFFYLLIDIYNKKLLK